MKCILDALHDGRLIELPDNNKNSALEYLATLDRGHPGPRRRRAASPRRSLPARQRTIRASAKAGPARTRAAPRTADMVCSLGWSPAGIDYGAPDGEPVHMVVMYFVPDTQKNSYLKEISSLARAIQTQPAMQDLKSLEDLNDVRHKLLDAITIALEATGPEAKARMIQLEVRHAAAEAAAPVPTDLARLVAPVSIIVVPGAKPVALAQDRDLVTALESAPNLVSQLAEKNRAELSGLQVVVRSSANYQPDRLVYECFAFRV